MDLGRFSAVTLTKIVRGKLVPVQICAWHQCRSYRPPGLSSQEKNRVERVQKPFIPDEAMPHLQEWQKLPQVQKSYKRKAWAKFGSASGVNIKDILPTKEEIEEEWEAEKQWWPTLQETQKEIKEENEKIEQERLAYEKRVAENMAKMPKWIEEWKAEQEKLKAADDEKAEKREAMMQRALEEVDYKLDPNSKQFRDYFRDFMNQERLAKKKAKKLAKQMKKQ